MRRLRNRGIATNIIPRARIYWERKNFVLKSNLKIEFESWRGRNESVKTFRHFGVESFQKQSDSRFDETDAIK